MNVKPIKRFFETKPMQKFYKKVCDPKYDNFFNNTLPTLETVVSTSCYVVSTEKQKNIPREQKNVLQWQNVLSGLAGMAMGSYLNHKVTNFANKLAPKVNKDLVEDVHKVSGGIRILLPLIMTAMTMRLVMPVLTAQVSTIIEDKRRAKAKLNVNA